MILSELPEHYEVVTQNDHAQLAAEILALIRLPELIAHPRRETLLLAVREHDSGWRGANSAPRVDPSGRPLGFRDVADEDRREIWDQTCADAAQHDPHVALLIGQHAIRLHQDREGQEVWDEWLAGLRQQRDEHLEASELAREEAEVDYGWLELADLCSLVLCGGLSGDFVAGGFEARLREPDSDATAARTLQLTPFPLAGPTTFRAPCRRIERRPYATDRELGGALAVARWSHRAVTIAPAGG